MSIVLNEREWAQAAIEERQLGKRPTETLGRIAKYYYQVDGYTKREIRGKLEDFLLQCDPNIILQKWTEILDRAVRGCAKNKLIEVGGVNVTEAELAAVRGIEGKQLQRLAFAMLCVAKYWNAASPTNSNWVNLPDKELMGLANISTSVRRQSQFMHQLRDAGLIRYSRRVDSLNVQVTFVQGDSPVVATITDFRNLGNQYQMLCGERFFNCEQCGLTIKRKVNNQKYCPECASEVYIRQSVESVMHKRGSGQAS